MNLLCKYANSMTNTKINNIINNEIMRDVPLTPHQSIGDINQNDKEIINDYTKNSEINIKSTIKINK